MHKVFGDKIDTEYKERKGAYLIPIVGNKVAIVKTNKGYFFLGGGIEDAETDEECIHRECIEEIGYEVEVGESICSAETYELHSKIGYFHPVQRYYYGSLLKYIQKPVEEEHDLLWINYEELKGNLYLEMQNWALQKCLDRYGCNSTNGKEPTYGKI